MMFFAYILDKPRHTMMDSLHQGGRRMGFNLRGAIMSNIQGSSQDEVEATIVDALDNGEEKMLPGLGVLLEVYWQNANESEKEQLCAEISKGLN